MPTFTVQNIVDRAAAIADMHDTFVQPFQWLAWFNVERRALEIFKARHSGGAALQNLQSISVTGVDKVSLTSSGVGELMALVGVWENVSGRLRPLRIVNWIDHHWQDEAGPYTGKAQFVRVEDANTDGIEVATQLRFYPRDPTGQYLIYYVKAPAAATALTDIFSQPLGLEERIVLGMARRALIKEESDTSAIDKLIAEQDRLVEEYCWNRSFAQGNSVRNVDRVQRGWIDLDGFVPPGPDFWMWI